MSRFLFVVPPWARHVTPTVPVGVELATRGHCVAWSGHPEVVRDLLPTGAAFLPIQSAVPRLQSQGRRGPAVVRALWEDVHLPLAQDMVPGVAAAVDTFRPDVVVADQQALAGAAVAIERRLPWVTTMASVAEVGDPVASLPLVARWIRGLLGDLLVDVGVPAGVAADVDPRFSPYLVVAFMAEALAPARGCPRGVVFVGPSLGDRPDDRHHSSVAASELGDKPLVLLDPGPLPTLATVRLLALASQALARIGAQTALLTAESPRANLLDRASAVVTHGGQATVDEALAHGVPLVLAPLGGEQPIVASQVVSAGAGVRVKLGHLRVDDLQAAIEAAMFDPTLRAGAARVRDAGVRAGGHRVAAERMEALSAATLTHPRTPVPRSVPA